MLRRLIDTLRPSNSELARRVPNHVLLGWYFRKAAGPTLRGLIQSPFMGSVRLPIFIGRSTSISYRRKLFLGRGVSLGANSTVQAFSSQGVRIASRVTIRERAWIQCSSHPSMPGVGLSIGAGTYIGPGATIGVGGPVHIGAGCQIGANFTVVSENHADSPSGRPSKTEVTRVGVRIANDCWIGHGVTVLDGVELGEGCTVGAGAVVTRSFAAGARIAGVPARLLDS